jgi:uncharacterized protein
MRLLAPAIAALAAPLALGCFLWEPPPDSYELPPPDFPAPEIDVPMVNAGPETELWLAKSPIGSLYLFGSTAPAGEADPAAFGADVADAYEKSDEIVYEVDLHAIEPARMVALMRRYGTLPQAATLESEVSHETWTLLQERFAEAGQSSDAVRSMRPWLVSFAIANHASFAASSDPVAGIVDRVREQTQAHAASPGAAKRVVGLSSVESQFRMYSEMPRAVQDAVLRQALGGGPLGRLDGSVQQRIWLTGEDWFAQLDAPTREQLALVYEHMVYRRNEHMADRLFHIAIDGKIRFVAVGSLHLVGERGIPALLAQRGFRVSRLL